MSMSMCKIVCAVNLELFSAGREKVPTRTVQQIFNIIMTGFLLIIIPQISHIT
jgi:hypothetical protein